jgi:hypothetical protein
MSLYIIHAECKCGHSKHDFYEGECPRCMIEQLERKLNRVIKEREQMIKERNDAIIECAKLRKAAGMEAIP